jgi:tRNA threonylcarbamoyladenosine biosynthesis protein TsaB
MRLLALDTATEACGIALLADGQVKVELNLSHGQTHAKHLMSGVEAVLNMAAVPLNDVDGFAVTRGPGSFTGLRIGISTVKGLSLAGDKPVVGVSSLEVLAHQADDSQEWICPMIDARRREVYWSLYRRYRGELGQVEAEQVGSAAVAAEKIKGPCRFIGSGALAYRPLIEEKVNHFAHWGSGHADAINIGWVARLAWERFSQGNLDDVGDLGPVYLRKSDAEINLAGRQNQTSQKQETAG